MAARPRCRRDNASVPSARASSACVRPPSVPTSATCQIAPAQPLLGMPPMRHSRIAHPTPLLHTAGTGPAKNNFFSLPERQLGSVLISFVTQAIFGHPDHALVSSHYNRSLKAPLSRYAFRMMRPKQVQANPSMDNFMCFWPSWHISRSDWLQSCAYGGTSMNRSSDLLPTSKSNGAT